MRFEWCSAWEHPIIYRWMEVKMELFYQRLMESMNKICHYHSWCWCFSISPSFAMGGPAVEFVRFEFSEKVIYWASAALLLLSIQRKNRLFWLQSSQENWTSWYFWDHCASDHKWNSMAIFQKLISHLCQFIIELQTVTQCSQSEV